VVSKLGPEYSKMMDGLEQVDQNSSEGKEFMSILSGLDKLCTGPAPSQSAQPAPVQPAPAQSAPVQSAPTKPCAQTGNLEVGVPIEDLFDTGLFTTRLEKLDRVFCNVGRFGKNLSAFKDQGYVSLLQYDAMNAVLDAGHAVTHRFFKPSEQDLGAALAMGSLFHRVSLAHIRRIFARTSTGSRVRPSPSLTDFGGGHDQLLNWSNTELGMKRVRCA
jgi:hypothetical protein